VGRRTGRGPEFTALQAQERAALKKEPRKNPRPGPAAVARRATAATLGTDPGAADRPKGILALMTTAQRLLDLAAAAPDSHSEDLLLLLREASELYQLGLEDLRHTVAVRFAGLTTEQLRAAANAADIPCDPYQERDELLLLLALTEWEMTPAAIAYSAMAEDAARRGVCIIPEG
jgi:hypothetical protein